MANTNETITDIIRKTRAEADYIEEIARDSLEAGEDLNGMPFTKSAFESALCLAKRKREEADRLEAALKRELATAEKPSAVGDRAKMREAVEKVIKITEREWDAHRETSAMWDIHEICTSALAEPTRNCDRFATLEDARKEHHKICEEYGACNKACGYKSGHSGTYQCFEAWLFAPAMEQKGETDGDK